MRVLSVILAVLACVYAVAPCTSQTVNAAHACATSNCPGLSYDHALLGCFKQNCLAELTALNGDGIQCIQCVNSALSAADALNCASE